ncbi:DUF2946 domain-containing protein [Acinetobacter soli]|uniref:DUF2946 domain-containing protein n=1 Tax=Acinetobacter TaxID=469 RepID=UPI001D17258B|nr:MULTISPECIES: DUF2946 domain-containing protein [Acinetobacter]WEH89610.1 DUF2946 domain-containing protein [Acinetobacter soli]
MAAFAAMLMQISVFLQPLLPEKYQVSRVCMTLSILKSEHDTSHKMIGHSDHQAPFITRLINKQHSPVHDSHMLDHSCVFCTVHGFLVVHLDADIKEVFERVRLQLLQYQAAFKHVYFQLKRLFLSPQGRAPPVFS